MSESEVGVSVAATRQNAGSGREDSAAASWSGGVKGPASMGCANVILAFGSTSVESAPHDEAAPIATRLGSSSVNRSVSMNLMAFPSSSPPDDQPGDQQHYRRRDRNGQNQLVDAERHGPDAAAARTGDGGPAECEEQAERRQRNAAPDPTDAGEHDSSERPVAKWPHDDDSRSGSDTAGFGRGPFCHREEPQQYNVGDRHDRPEAKPG